MQSFYKFSNNEYRPMLFKVKDDYCSARPGLASLKLVNVLTKMWGNRTNMFQQCPYLPGEYYVKDFNFDASHLPSVIPAGRYLITSFVRTAFSEWFFNASVYFYVANHGILDLGVG